jgi:FtsP/CotA-like multicopper oxidase with cupredoxin domain
MAPHDSCQSETSFRALNAGTSRTLQLGLSIGDDLIVIASDAGLLNAPVRTNALRIGVAERYEFEDHDMMTQFEVGEGGCKPCSTPAQPLPAPRYYTPPQCVTGVCASVS